MSAVRATARSTRHLLVIGAQRSGTTYLHAMLDAHPQITMARPSRPEPKVFCSGDLAARGLDWYRSTYFAHARDEVLLGEKSTSYLEDAEAADRARAVLGEAEIVVLLRDPIDRAVSNWRFSTAGGFEERPLRQALTENLTTTRAWDPVATSVSPYAYLERGRYADHLRPWLACFPRTVHVRFFEELVGDGDAIGELYGVLGVDDGFRPAETESRVNESDEDAPPLDADLVERLRAYFTDSDTALRGLLGRDLPWSTTG